MNSFLVRCMYTLEAGVTDSLALKIIFGAELI